MVRFLEWQVDAWTLRRARRTPSCRRCTRASSAAGDEPPARRAAPSSSPWSPPSTRCFAPSSRARSAALAVPYRWGRAAAVAPAPSSTPRTLPRARAAELATLEGPGRARMVVIWRGRRPRRAPAPLRRAVPCSPWRSTARGSSTRCAPSARRCSARRRAATNLTRPSSPALESSASPAFALAARAPAPRGRAPPQPARRGAHGARVRGPTRARLCGPLGRERARGARWLEALGRARPRALARPRVAHGARRRALVAHAAGRGQREVLRALVVGPRRRADRRVAARVAGRRRARVRRFAAQGPRRARARCSPAAIGSERSPCVPGARGRSLLSWERARRELGAPRATT